MFIRVPIEDMPKNLHKLIKKEEYLYALLHPDGFQKGIFDVIHMNKSYPEWHNLILNANADDGIDDKIVAYTREGWRVKPISYVIEQLHNEYFLCFTYLYENREKMWPGINNSNNSNDAELKKMCEIISKRTHEEEIVDSAMRTVANMMGMTIRKNIENITKND